MQILELNKMAANYFYYQLRTENGAQAMRYLKNRQLDDETIKSFGLGYCEQIQQRSLSVSEAEGHKRRTVKRVRSGKHG